MPLRCSFPGPRSAVRTGYSAVCPGYKSQVFERKTYEDLTQAMEDLGCPHTG